MIFMGLVLKIPVAAACWLIWHAIRAEPDPAILRGRAAATSRTVDFRREPKRPRARAAAPTPPARCRCPAPRSEGTLRVARRPADIRTASGTAD